MIIEFSVPEMYLPGMTDLYLKWGFCNIHSLIEVINGNKKSQLIFIQSEDKSSATSIVFSITSKRRKVRKCS